MNASQGREPARPQQGTGAGGAKNSTAAAQPRLSREAVVAFVLLPVLLAAGFFLGGRLLGEDSPTTIDAAPVDASPTADDAAAPGTDEPDAEPSIDPAASPTEVPAVVGPPAPAEETEPAAEPTTEPAAEPTTEPAAEPTEAPTEAPVEEPTQEPTEAPVEEPTEAPVEEPTEAPTEEPTQAPTEEPAPTQVTGEPNLQTVVEGIPQPVAGDGVLLFPGAANEDVRTWQARMVERGWDLAVDGIYGERTAQVAQSFQLEKGLVVDGLVGPQTWSAAWTAPIT